ncbi:MAG: TlpA disulfide reductase family protein [Myxococcota bacterium]
MTARPGVLLLAPLLALGCPGVVPEEVAEEPAAEWAPPAPDFSLRDLDGNQVTLETLRGRVVVIDFWATWCAPCVFQIPVLNAFAAAHATEGVTVLGISVDADGQEAVRAFAEQHGIAYPVLLGDESLARQFGAVGFPSLFVVAPDGTLDSSHVGIVEAATLEAALSRARQRPEGA